VEFEFKVDGQGAKVFGDGFAFWVTRDRAETGEPTSTPSLITLDLEDSKASLNDSRLIAR
jgi:hypothetical protein